MTRKVICVLKTGGDFDWTYVEKLRHGVLANVTGHVEFHVYTDIPLAGPNIHPLEHGLPGWWSKLEMFQEQGSCIYMDLDTIVADDITPMFEALETHGGPVVLEDFMVPGKLATGIIGWVGKSLDGVLRWGIDTRPWEDYEGDADWVIDKGVIDGPRWQHLVSGIYSYKRHFRNRGPRQPDDPRVVCFHGKPRPHEVGWRFR